MLTRLDESLFYLIVFGPGFGESVCLHVPPSQWVVVDGCARRGRSYPQHLVSLYPESTMAAVALTHPHLDHARGLLELVEDRAPARMGCLPPLDAVNESTALDNPELDMAEGETEHLISRMHSEWLFRPECRWELFAGRELTVGEAQIVVLSPDVSCRDRYLEERRAGHAHANQISSAMRVSWRGLTLVLGADLERLPAGSGWEGVCTRWPSLRNHHELKIPHHASQTAVCERLGARATDTEGT